MTVWEYAELFRERWRMIALGVLLGLVVATGVVLLSPRIYESHVTIFISAQSAGDPAAAADSGELTAQRMETYIQLITSDRIAGEVARDLGLNTTGAELAERVSASTEPDTVLITGTVTDSDPERASQVANVLAARFMDHVAELEQPADITVPPPIAAKVFEAAVPAMQPISPRPAPILAIGALLGLFAGLGLAVLRALLDTSVTTTRRLAEVVGAPVLGALLPTGPAAAGRLVMRDDRKGPQAEAFREVRANLRLVDRDAEHPHRVILVTSAGPGEGRTTTACNLAFATAAAGARVLLVDADLRRPRVAAVFGLDGRPGLTDLLAERVREDEVVHRCEDRLDVVPSGPVPPDPGEMLASPPMHTLLAGVRDRYDVVLLDGPPLRPVADALTLTATADGVVLVVRYASKAERLQAAREALDTASASLLGAVMTDVPPKVMRGDRSDAAYLGAAAGESSSSSGSDPTAERGSGRPDDGVAEPAGDGRAGDESPGDPRRAGSAR